MNLLCQHDQMATSEKELNRVQMGNLCQMDPLYDAHQ
jgi:hypothetical protein